MKTYQLLLVAAAFLSQTACETAQTKVKESGAPQLTSAQILQVLTGNSVSDESSKAKNVWQAYFEEGTVRARLVGSGKEEHDSGTWRVTEDNLYCRTWNNWGQSKEGCKKVYQTAENEIIFIPTDSSKPSDITILTEGNTYDL